MGAMFWAGWMPLSSSEDLEALLLDLRRRRVPLHGVDLLGAQGLAQQGTELDRLGLLELDPVDLGVALEALGAARLEALGPGAEHVVQRDEVGDLGGGGVAADDEGVPVDGRRVVEDGGADGRVRRADHRHDRRRVGRRRRVGHQRGGRAADVVDDQVDVAVLQGVDGLGALAGGGEDVDVVALGLQVLAVGLGDGLGLAEVLAPDLELRPGHRGGRRRPAVVVAVTAGRRQQPAGCQQDQQPAQPASHSLLVHGPPLIVDLRHARAVVPLAA